MNGEPEKTNNSGWDGDYETQENGCGEGGDELGTKSEGARQVPGRWRDPRKPVAFWIEPDALDGQEVRAAVLLLRTRGCSWARCTMCGYHREAAPAGGEDVLAQFRTWLERVGAERVAKLYTSGSFFDGREIPADTRLIILEEAGRRFERVVVESRPEFLTEEALRDAINKCPQLEVAIGLESASPRVLEWSVRKGLTPADFERAAGLVHRMGARVRSYVLLKPPFLTELEALEDAVASILRAAPLSDVVSLNPVNVQRGTLVERLWRLGLYRPPWLWTAAECIAKAVNYAGAAGAHGPRLVCAPSGAGSPRGAHNCGSCDDAVTRALRNFSISQSAGDLKTVIEKGCACMDEWRHTLALGLLTHLNHDALLRAF
ncbi:MAG: archaeosine biosynthesis radical SAM protein RaSEA [Thermoplasmata archaeon]